MRGLFDPVVDEIKALIEEQLLEADRKSAGIDVPSPLPKHNDEQV